MSEGNATISEFAKEYGTADPSERKQTGEDGDAAPGDGQQSAAGGDSEAVDSGAADIEVEYPVTGPVDEEYIRPDGHVPIDRVPKYWEDERVGWNLIPRGRFSVVFDPSGCETGWQREDTVTDEGVYLPDRHVVTPPAPVEVDDQLLSTAVDAALEAARTVLNEYNFTSAPVVAVTKENRTTLDIQVGSNADPRQRELFNSARPDESYLPVTVPATDDSPALFKGFSHVRLFNNKSGKPGHEIYTKATQPRLSLREVGYTSRLV